MRYLITGGAGFIGSHLCELLLAQGHRVVAIDDLSTGRVENIAHLRPLPHFQLVRENIQNEQVLDRLTSESDVVVHLAAMVGVQRIVEDPVRTIRTNIMGTEAVLAAARAWGRRELVFTFRPIYRLDDLDLDEAMLKRLYPAARVEDGRFLLLEFAREFFGPDWRLEILTRAPDLARKMKYLVRFTRRDRDAE